MRISMAIALCSAFLILDESRGQLECRPGPPPTEETLGLKGGPVAYLDRIEPDSNAQKAGLVPGDLIVGFNGQDMRAFPSFESCLAELRLAAVTDKAVIDVLKYDRSSDSYHPSVVTVTVAGSKERYVGFASHFAYVVTAVSPGGLAERLGVRAGDFVEKAAGQRVGNLRGPVELDQIVSESAMKSRGRLVLSLSRWRPMKDGTIRGETREARLGP